jgi:hypothetical protein
MFVILTSKPGKFRTELVPGLRPVERYDYLFYGRKKAEFVIAELTGEVRLRVIDEAEPPVVNEVPAKFLQQFATVAQALAELRHLTAFGGMDVVLQRRA